MSTGINIKEPKNLESKSKMGKAWERAIDRMDFLEAKENESNTIDRMDFLEAKENESNTRTSKGMKGKSKPTTKNRTIIGHGKL